MRTTTSTRNDSAARRELVLGAQVAQDQLPPSAADDNDECECDDCDCPVCGPGCC